MTKTTADRHNLAGILGCELLGFFKRQVRSGLHDETPDMLRVQLNLAKLDILARVQFVEDREQAVALADRLLESILENI